MRAAVVGFDSTTSGGTLLRRDLERQAHAPTNVFVGFVARFSAQRLPFALERGRTGYAICAHPVTAQSSVSGGAVQQEAKPFRSLALLPAAIPSSCRMHDLSFILTLTGGLAAALAFGAITRRLGLSSLVGYMLAGIVVGPHTPGFVADARVASQMADIGVILLMFGVGMHFHPQELLRVWRVAVPGAAVQVSLAAAAGWVCARVLGWSHGAGAVFGLALGVASTVVLARMLVESDRIATREGQVAMGWLIVQDLFAVLALVLLPALATDRADVESVVGELPLAIAKVVVFAGLVWALGTRLFAPLMERMARMRSTELLTLTVFVVALGVAVIAAEVF